MNKRRLLSLISLLLFTTNAIAQRDAFSSYYGRTILLGDTLWVGAPEFCKGIFHSELSENNLISPANMQPYYYQPLVVDSLPQDMVLMDYNYTNQTIDAICSAPDGTRFYIDIDNAVYYNEIQMGARYDDSSRKKYMELTELVKLLYYIHTEQIAIDDDTILKYILLVNPELGGTCQHDKFTFRRERDRYLSLLQAELATFPEQMKNTVYYYSKQIVDKLGNEGTYNPEINGYLITDLYDCQSGFNYGYNTHDIVLLYQPCRTTLEMPEAKAEQYERKLKGNSQYLYRQEYAMVYVNLMPFDQGAYIADKFVCALFITAELFDHPSCMYNYLGTVSYDPQHYDKVLKQQKRELLDETVDTVVDVAGGILGILSIFK